MCVHGWRWVRGLSFSLSWAVQCKLRLSKLSETGGYCTWKRTLNPGTPLRFSASGPELRSGHWQEHAWSSGMASFACIVKFFSFQESLQPGYHLWLWAIMGLTTMLMVSGHIRSWTIQFAWEDMGVVCLESLRRFQTASGEDSSWRPMPHEVNAKHAYGYRSRNIDEYYSSGFLIIFILMHTSNPILILKASSLCLSAFHLAPKRAVQTQKP